MSNYTPAVENCIESEHRTTTNDDNAYCISCGERRIERFKITLRQPLHGNGYGRIELTGSVCSRCADEMQHNARTEEDR